MHLFLRTFIGELPSYQTRKFTENFYPDLVLYSISVETRKLFVRSLVLIPPIALLLLCSFTSPLHQNVMKMLKFVSAHRCLTFIWVA